ncbi:Amidase domain-containing protein [Mycena indigotica]|uniref:amidase n=1 Tax=Mycena indigotica TaxID=2126181 RepID=A0A8H6VQY6_9AGAR|nr:Amidase domain-containing protein [Mycena indigotica]KAF7290792.1 Amidase domain-containing protein [Mycena indigotica]
MSPTNSDIEWPQVALRFVDELYAKIPPELRLSQDFLDQYPPGSDVRAAVAACGLLSKDEMEITNPEYDSVSLLRRIKDKEVTAVQVARAFCKRAAVAQQLLHCLTDFFMEVALRRAQELDDHYNTTGELVGPLHGLPIDMKDHMMVKGTKSSGGFVCDYLHPPASYHGITAQILYDAGAVFFVKTNQPQSIMHLETYSFFGQTLNPYNTALTSGGSSGGCSALVAFGGSTLGIGSDIGGSLRSPSNACGLWTLKPTCSRLPTGHGYIPMPGADSISGTFGPICRSLRDINLFFSVVLDTKPWLKAPEVVPIPWEIPASPSWSGTNGRLRVGVMWHDEVVLPQPPVRRALKTFADALKGIDDIEVVDYKPFKHHKASALAHELYFTDGGARIRSKAAETGEPILPLTEWVITYPSVKDHTMHEHWELAVEREVLRAEYLEYFNAQNVDVVLCPAGAGPAPELGTCKYWAYTNVWNFVDYPAAVFPTGLLCDPALDKTDGPREYMSEADEYNAKCYSDRPETFKGAPLCLQLVGKRYKEELLMRALEEISEALPLQNLASHQASC